MTVDFLKVPLGLKKPVLKEVAVGPPKRPQPAALERYKARRSDAMDTESQYSGYSYKSGHSRSSRKHRWVQREQISLVERDTSLYLYGKVVG